MRESLSHYALPLAWLVALTATLGSLYYSEVANFIPCKLCWYQRIAMYPLAVILGIAALKRDVSVRLYALPLVTVGGAVSIYHYLVERFPDLAGSMCDPAAPCSFLWVWEFHFISIPFQALSGFVLIGALMFLLPRTTAGSGGREPADKREVSETSQTRTGDLIHS
jgi:disulfide bond formation protein DsbB